MFPLRTQITVTKSDTPVLTYTFVGELDETNADKTFQPIYTELQKDWTQDVVFDLSGLTYLNSKAIGYITDIYSHTDNHGGSLTLRNLTEQVYDILDIVGITSVVTIEDGSRSV